MNVNALMLRDFASAVSGGKDGNPNPRWLVRCEADFLSSFLATNDKDNHTSHYPPTSRFITIRDTFQFGLIHCATGAG